VTDTFLQNFDRYSTHRDSRVQDIELAGISQQI
jgi:hypothetical protein